MFKLFITITFLLAGQPVTEETIYTTKSYSVEECTTMLIDATTVFKEATPEDTMLVKELRDTIEDGIEEFGADGATLVLACRVPE